MAITTQILDISAASPAKFNKYAVIRREPVLDAHIERYLLQDEKDKAVLTFYKKRASKEFETLFRARKKNADRHPLKILNIVEYGFYKKTPCWYEISKHSKFGPLANIFNTARAYSRQITFSAIVEGIFSIIDYFHSRNLALLNLKPSNIIINNLYPLELVLKEADNFGMSNAENTAEDYYDFGLTLLDLFLGAHPDYSASKTYMIHSITAAGSDLPLQMPRHLKRLLSGLSAGRNEKRWGAEEVKKWLAEGHGRVELLKHRGGLLKQEHAKTLIPPEEYKKICESYKLPLEIKNALSGADRQKYLSGVKEFINLRNENLFITLKEAREFIESAACDKFPEERLYEDLERTAGYYKISQCIKNAADPALYEGLAALRNKIMGGAGAGHIKIINNYLRALLYKNIRWSAEDKKIAGALLNIKWDMINEKIYGRRAGAVENKSIIAAAGLIILAAFAYSLHAEKYYLMLFSLLALTHISYIIFTPPDYEKVYKTWRQRIDEASGLYAHSETPAGVEFNNFTAAGSAANDSGPFYPDADSREIFDRFIYAVKTGNYKETQKLIQRGADINAKDSGGASALIWAADTGNLKIIKLLTGYGADVNACDNQGAGALMWAAYKGNETAVKFLIEAGAAKDARDMEGHTPLMAACFNSHAGAVRALLEAGCDFKTADHAGNGVLAYAKNSGCEDIAAMITGQIDATAPAGDKKKAVGDFIFDTLADCGVTDAFELIKAAVTANKKAVRKIIESADSADASCSRFIKACAAGNYDLARKMIDIKIDINARDRRGYSALIWAVDKRRDRITDLLLENGADADLSDSYGYTPLIWAIERNDLCCVKKLTGHKADIDRADNKGITPLMWAVIKKRYDIAGELIKSGCDAAKFDHKGYSALSCAIEKKLDNFIELTAAAGSKTVIDNPVPRPLILWAAARSKTALLKLAVSRGAALDIKDEYGRTALIHCINSRNIDAVALLIKSGAAVNLCDNGGAGALIHAVNNWFYDIARLLLEAGADLTIKDNRQKTAMDYAVDKNYNTIIEMLIDAGADVNARNYDGSTLLTWSAGYKNTALTRYLIYKGADINAGDSKNFSALMRAAENGHLEMVKLLVESGANPAAKNSDGETAYDLAVRNKREKSAVYLKNIPAVKT
jgi:ankyrin repeat protein